MTANKQPRKITGRMVFWGLVVFFGVIAAVNAVFAYFALETWPGLTTQDAYKKGLAYNQTLADAERQAALGWRSRVTLSEDGKVRVTMTDRTGAPLLGLNVRLVMSRPVGDLMKTTLDVSEVGNGVYESAFQPPVHGRWKASMVVDGNGGHQRFRMVHEVMAKK